MMRGGFQNHFIMMGLVLVWILTAVGLVSLFVLSRDASPVSDSASVSQENGNKVAALSDQPGDGDSTAAATHWPTATPTATATPTSHPSPTATPAPTATRTPRPTRTPNPARSEGASIQVAGQPTRPKDESANPPNGRTNTSTPSPLDCLDATYLADVTVPDHTHLEKGEQFIKTWRVRNSGSCDWPQDTQLIFADGNQLGALDSVTVGALAANEITEISVEMTAPDADDGFQGTWRFAAESGRFGTLLTVVIQVGQAPTPAPTSAANPAPPPPPPIGRIGGGFELGGQTHTLAHPNEMRQAGMTWVKFQHKWSPGQNPSEVAGRIQVAHDNGFKILLSIPGGSEYPTGIDFGGYTEFLRGVAALGPDGIEVWNEQNIDREWPSGTIDPTAYVNNILAPAYNAIKSVNPNILVISGAPAPTGFFGGGCGAAGCDDAPYIAGMLASGAARYVDCIGIHYNEGILPPSQTSGDPRGNSGHYTRYFWGMVNTYWANFGGARPLCFTELGYVSPEGYGPLPSNFAWAANTTVAQQATWLAQAAVLASNSGKVRLMIVYNVDFTLYSDSDPQAGYGIIRPGGGCPACETLHSVTH